MEAYYMPGLGNLTNNIFNNGRRTRVRAVHSENTKRAYAADWKHFVAWCKSRRYDPLHPTPEQLSEYLVEISCHLSVASIERRMAGISQLQFEKCGIVSPVTLTHPLVHGTWAQIVHQSTRKQSRAKALSTAQLKTIIGVLSQESTSSLRSQRINCQERALLLLGFAGAFRRSELVKINVEDVQIDDQGALITLPKSKSDQEGRGAQVAIFRGESELCPVNALSDWLDESRILTGRVFRTVGRAGFLTDSMSARTVSNVLVRRMKRAGLDPKGYSAHSLRAGMISEAAKRGASERDIARISRHKSLDVLRGYIRLYNPWECNPTNNLGL